MVLLLLPLVAAILFCERQGILYPPQEAVHDSLCVHTFIISSESRHTAKCERYEAQTYGGKVYVYVLRDSTRSLLHSGDTIIASTRIKHADSIGSFDYRTYLLRQGIIGTAYVNRYDVHPCPPHTEPLQKRLYQRLSEAGLAGDELATVGALTLGYKEELDPELRHRFQASGAAHVLAVSGLHTGIIYALLLGLLTLGGRMRPLYENRIGRWVIGCIIIAGLWGYAWLTGMTPSVVRAVIMMTLLQVGWMCYRQVLSLNSIAAAAVLILLFRPLDLWSVSFQLSFTATFAIVAIGSLFQRMLTIKKPGKWHIVVTYIVGIIAVSIAAQVGTLPLTIYYFGQVSTYFLLTNLLVLPLVTVLVPCGLISLLLGGTVCGLWFSKLTWCLAWLMNHSVGWIESLPGSTFPASANGWMVAIYYTIFLLLCWVVNPKD